MSEEVDGQVVVDRMVEYISEESDQEGVNYDVREVQEGYSVFVPDIRSKLMTVKIREEPDDLMLAINKSEDHNLDFPLKEAEPKEGTDPDPIDLKPTKRDNANAIVVTGFYDWNHVAMQLGEILAYNPTPPE